MLFNSLNFWIIFPFIFIIYWIIPLSKPQLKKFYLILVSYLLYMNWNPFYALILLGVSFISYYGGLFFNHERQERKIGVITIYVLLTLFPLLLFKYYNFINDSIYGCLAVLGLKFHLPGLNWAVPIGISFFTFQALGYLWDVYYGRIKAEKSLFDYLLFLSFFPQTASGPISKASELLPQIKKSHSFRYEQARDGLKLLLWGMFLKVVVADRLGLYVDSVYNNYEQNSGLTCFVASIFYSFQIYGDFAGYSYMAIGIAKTLGFNLINNFNHPYLAFSVTDFWRRWHISLSRWLKDYVYIPMGGNRCGKLKCYCNILVTFLVSGIWHGANWTFIAWGMIHGIIQVIEKYLGLQKCETKYILIKILRISITFLLINFAWIFFRMPTINEAFIVIEKIFTDFSNFDPPQIAEKLYIAIGLVVLCTKDLYDESNWKITLFQKSILKYVYYLILACLILSIGVLDGSTFIYSQF